MGSRYRSLKKFKIFNQKPRILFFIQDVPEYLKIEKSPSQVKSKSCHDFDFDFFFGAESQVMT